MKCQDFACRYRSGREDMGSGNKLVRVVREQTVGKVQKKW